MKRVLLVLAALILVMAHAAFAEEDWYEGEPMPEAAAPFEGVWQCDRASIEMWWEQVGFKVLITWGSSAWEQTEWEYSCYYHEDDGTVVSLPFGLRNDCVYGEDGSLVSWTEVYDDGEAVFSIDGEGRLIWQDLKENAGEGMRFEKQLKAAAQPLFATVGEAMEAEGFDGMYTMGYDYYVVIVQIDGQYVRVVADLDDTIRALNDAIFEAEDIGAAFEAVDEYAKTLPVAYSEEITAIPLEQAELDALAGKSLGELAEEGFEESSSGYGSEEGPVVFNLVKGMYEYEFIMNEGPEVYEALWDSWDFSAMTVKSGSFFGISGRATDLDYRADGAFEPRETNYGWDADGGWDGGEGLEQFNELMEIIGEAVAAAGEGAEVDAEALILRIAEIIPEASEEDIRTMLNMLSTMDPSSLIPAE